MKQVCYPKATTTGDISVEKGKPEANRYEFAGTALLALPIPQIDASQRRNLASFAKSAMEIADEISGLSGQTAVLELSAGKARSEVDHLRDKREALKRHLVVLQEEIDWLIYSCFGLAETYKPAALTEAAADLRPFLSNNVPSAWNERKKRLGQRSELRFLEDPLYKRPWFGRQGVFGHGSSLSWQDEVRIAGQNWLQERVEKELSAMVRPTSLRMLSHTLASVASAKRVRAALADPDETDANGEGALRLSDAVPYLAVLRHTDVGAKKRAEWERVWGLQRREDAGEKLDIPVPPKYDSKDFRDPAYWRLRGKLDVPKERFISYPGAEKDDDKSPLFG
jgi:hypothetical protein